jgi:diacylglycerol kinase (ATP)
MMVVISNGRRFGGAFSIAPAALVDDGLLDLVAVGDVRGLARVALFTRALRGTHLAHPRVTALQADTFALRFSTPPVYEVDGEVRRASSADVRVTCVRKAIRVLAASTVRR